MKISLWISIFMWVILDQEPQIIKTKYSSKEAVIFSKNYNHIPVIQKGAFRFTPELRQILLVEGALRDSVKDFKRNYRQYAGYLNENDSIIVSNFLKPSIIERQKETWKTEFIFGIGSHYEKNQRILYYNLATKEFINP